MLLSDWLGSFRKRRRLLPVRRRFRNKLLHPFQNFVGAVLRLYNRFSVFFLDIYLCTRSNTETISDLLWKNDSPF
jgi:hypothetical protein